MPRKRWRTRVSSYEIPNIDPHDRNAIEDHDLVRHVLVDFDELAVLSSETREQLVADLVAATSYARGGIKAGKRHVSDEALGKHVFMFDIKRAFTTSWPTRFGDAFGLHLPQYLKPLALRAAQIQYGVMSPAMKAAQDAELLAAGRLRLGGLAGRLKAPLTAWQERLDQFLLRLKAVAP